MTRPSSRRKHPISLAVVRLRGALNETQQQFANRMGVAITTIARYETSNPPTGQALAKLAQVAFDAQLFDLWKVFGTATPEEIEAELGRGSTTEDDKGKLVRSIPFDTPREFEIMTAARLVVIDPRFAHLQQSLEECLGPALLYARSLIEKHSDQVGEKVQPLLPIMARQETTTDERNDNPPPDEKR